MKRYYFVKNLEGNLKDLPIAKFIMQMTDLNLIDMSKFDDVMKMQSTIDENKMQLIAELKEPPAFDVTDHSMFPVMPKGSKATIEFLDIKDYKNGDIIYFTKDKKAMFRKCYFNDEDRTMMNLIALNQNYEMLTVNIKDITIMGKVKRLIVSFE
jgi:SOS-response transcriptional repressor LexA